MVEYDDPVRLLSLSQPMCDDQCGPSGRSRRTGTLQLTRTGTARLGRRLIQYGDRRVSEHQPGEGKLLRLCTCQRMAALPHNRVQAVRQRTHPGGCTDPVKCSFYFLSC